MYRYVVVVVEDTPITSGGLTDDDSQQLATYSLLSYISAMLIDAALPSPFSQIFRTETSLCIVVATMT